MKAIPVLAVAALLLTGCGAAAEAQKGQAVNDNPPASASIENDSPQGPAVPAEQPATKTHKVGEAVQFTTPGGSVVRVTVKGARYGTEPVGKYDSGAEKGGYLTLDILWESVSGPASSPGPVLFRLRDQQGYDYPPKIIGVDGGLGGDVAPGEKARGNVVFDTAPGPWTVTLGVFGYEGARWTVTA